MWRVPLRYTTAADSIYLRDLLGHDLLAYHGEGLLDLLQLLNRLVEVRPGACLKPGHCEQMPAADRDLVVAALHRRAFGPQVEMTAGCGQCDGRFDYVVDLVQFEQALLDGVDNSFPRDVLGNYLLDEQTSFRLPLGADEIEASFLPLDQREAFLTKRCVLAGDASKALTGMEAVAPLFEGEIEARCPHCGVQNEVPFAVPDLFRQVMLRERQRLLFDIRTLAGYFRWGLSEILDLTLPDRQQLVSLLAVSRTSLLEV